MIRSLALKGICAATVVALGAFTVLAASNTDGNTPMQLALAFDPDCATIQTLSHNSAALPEHMERYTRLAVSLGLGECVAEAPFVSFRSPQPNSHKRIPA